MSTKIKASSKNKKATVKKAVATKTSAQTKKVVAKKAVVVKKVAAKPVTKTKPVPKKATKVVKPAPKKVVAKKIAKPIKKAIVKKAVAKKVVKASTKKSVKVAPKKVVVKKIAKPIKKAIVKKAVAKPSKPVVVEKAKVVKAAVVKVEKVQKVKKEKIVIAKKPIIAPTTFRQTEVAIASNKVLKEPSGKFEMEFVIRASEDMVFEFVSTESGLSEWFCDDVNIRDGIFTFNWDGQIQQAKLVKEQPPILIRYQWLDKNDGSYFEFKTQKDELTNDISLIITDFAMDKADEVSARLLWHSQIDKLLHVLGSFF
jgi:uncharacterized protein YndB with AHSA1/START domain